MPKAYDENQLTDAEIYDLSRIRSVYPPGPLKDADRFLAERFGFSHTTLRSAMKGKRLTNRTLQMIRGTLPALLKEYAREMESERLKMKPWDACSQKEKAQRFVAGFREDEAARFMEAARFIFPSKFSPKT